MVRRQEENILRDIWLKNYNKLNKLDSLFTNIVNKVSKKKVIKEIEIKANKLNIIADKIEDKFLKDDVRIRELVSGFILPKI